MKNNYVPLFDNVLVKPHDEEYVSPGGIVLPDNAKQKSQVGEVVAIGPGVKNDKGVLEPMVVKVGDKVLYKKWGGNEVKVESKEWMLIEQKDLLAIVK